MPVFTVRRAKNIGAAFELFFIIIISFFLDGALVSVTRIKISNLWVHIVNVACLRLFFFLSYFPKKIETLRKHVIQNMYYRLHCKISLGLKGGRRKA